MMWELYDSLIDPLPGDVPIKQIFQNDSCTLVEAAGQIGGTTSNLLETRPPSLPSLADYHSLSWRECAALIKSWNFLEASIGAAALNAYYNQPARIEQYRQTHGEWFFFENTNPFPDTLDAIAGKKVAYIGHFHRAEEYLLKTAESYILERAPGPGDYPDSACEYILPKMDVVVITGFTFINKTLPRLLALCPQAHVILVGPSVCMAPVLFSMGVTELAGTALSNFAAVREYALDGEGRALIRGGTPLRFGTGKL